MSIRVHTGFDANYHHLIHFDENLHQFKYIKPKKICFNLIRGRI